MEVSSDLSQYHHTKLQENLRDSEQQLQHLVTELFIHGHADNAYQKLHDLKEKYLVYTRNVREMCNDVWAKFDLMSISLGILVIIVSLIANLFALMSCPLLSDGHGNISALVMVMAAVFVVYAGLQTFYMEGKFTSLMGYVLGLIDVVTMFIIIKKMKVNKDKTNSANSDSDKERFSYLPLLQIFAIISVTSSFLSFFSNSYVVHEDKIAMFFAQTLIWIFGICCIQHILSENMLNTTDSKHQKQRKSKGSNTNYDIRKSLTQPVMVVLGITMFCSISLRVGTNFRACREEQINCTLSSYLQPLSSLGNTIEGSKNIRYFFSAGCLILVLYLIRSWLRYHGNLNGNSFPVICVKYLLPISVISCIFHWAIQGLPEKTLNSLSIVQQTLFAQVVYGIVLLSLITVIIFPLLIFLVPQYGDNASAANGAKMDFLIQKVYNHMRSNWNSLSSESHIKDKPPIVYGLGTVYTSVVVYVGIAMYILLALLLGDGLSPSLLMSLLAMFTFLELYTVAVRLTGRETGINRQGFQ